jgi:probable HAF family extracellular repeat protein
LVPLGTPPGKTSVHAIAANRGGTAVVGSAGMSGGGAEAFEWTEQFHYEFLGNLGPEPTQFKNSGAGAVSADGSVVVGVANPGQFVSPKHAFRWTPAPGMESLGTLPTDYSSRATGVSADGSVIIGTSTGARPGNDWSQAFRWTAETGTVGLGD